jgi:glycosyltransferase involved in cell wall biosynthesis
MLTTIIITFNEADKIEQCIRSVQAFSDEIIVVDSMSSDTTGAKAESLGAKVYYAPFEGYGRQKRIAATYASHEWLFSIDADEVVSPELAAAINNIKQQADHGLYKINILTNFYGRWIRHCGWYPQPKIRLWRRDAGLMSDAAVHEGVVPLVAGQAVGHLDGDLLHYTFKGVGAYLEKINRYAALQALCKAKTGKKISLFHIWFVPKWTFFSDYLLRRGFLDGYAGYLVCKYAAHYTFVKYNMAREIMQQQGLSRE